MQEMKRKTYISVSKLYETWLILLEEDGEVSLQLISKNKMILLSGQYHRPTSALPNPPSQKNEN